MPTNPDMPAPAGLPRSSRRRALWGRFAVVVAFGLALAALYLYGPTEEAVLRRQGELKTLVAAHPVASAAALFLATVVLVALSVPTGVILSLLAGLFFGRWLGLLLAGGGNGVGALLSFLASRYLFHDLVRGLVESRPRLRGWVERIDRGVERSGAGFLFILRLSPVVPYSMLNPLCGLTRLPAFTYWWVSQVGMLPVLFVWVNAGAAVAEIRSARDLVSSELIVSLVLLATFPWLMYGLIWLARRWARR